MGVFVINYAAEILPSMLSFKIIWCKLTLVQHPAFANSVDPDQLASEEASEEANWSRSALFAIKYVKL